MNIRYVTRESVSLTLVVLGWFAAVAGGLLYFNNYETTPGSTRPSPDRWPTAGAVPFSQGKVNLVVFAHPRCPCTRASLAELKSLLKDCPAPVSTHILFWVPPNASSPWTTSDLWEQARAIADVQLVADEGGQQAHCFGATTSGHLMIFAPDGTRLYSGGLTNGRGRVGNDSGLAAIRTLIIQQQPLPAETAVFGCPLFNSPSSENGTELCQKPL
ncbi:MAG: hypothetical protein JWP89_5658 [Schlesneria sp.]|nr:hypothetical protein [Schlesneria sp.]